MREASDLLRISAWQPSRTGIASERNKYGFPTVIYRTPSRLVEECEKAYDAGLLLAALELVVTIPDVCARIAGSDYRKWSEDYLGLVNDGEKRREDRNPTKTGEEIDAGFSAMERRGIFTASDLYQLRCAVVHAGSSSIDDKGAGAVYSPFKTIGVCAQGDARDVVASYGHTGSGSEVQENCTFDCVVRLEGLISLMAKGVIKFIQEDPARDREYSLEKECGRRGIIDFRPLTSEAGR